MPRRKSRHRGLCQLRNSGLMDSLESRMLLTSWLSNTDGSDGNFFPASTATTQATLATSAAAATPVLANPSFEGTSANGFTYQPSGTGWTFTGGSGIQQNGSAWGAPIATNGAQTAFLQSGGQIDQTFTAVDGAYTFTFNGALRSYRSASAANQQIAVYIDGTLVNIFNPTSTSTWDNFTLTKALGTGNHTLSFRGTVSSGDTSAFLDNINATYVATPVSTNTSITNGGFEATAANGFAYTPSNAGWIFSGASGIQSNGSPWGAPTAPEGKQTAFLQSSSSIDQTVGIAADGTYTISFKGALRSYRSPGAPNQQIAVYIDSSLANVFSPSSTTAWDSFSLTRSLTAGSHTISFRGAVSNGDTTAFFDAVSISGTATPPPLASTTLLNRSFEATSAKGFTYGPAGASWTFSGGAGIQANGSAWGAPNAADGTQTAFLQSVSQIDQTIGVTADGTYTLSFKGALRGYRSPGAANQQVAVYIDNALVNVFSPTSVSSWDSFSVSKALTAGNHTLSFRGAVTSGDTSAFIDDVNLIASTSNPAPQFYMSATNAVDGNGQYVGFAVAGVQIAPAGGGAAVDLTPRKISETVVDGSTVNQVWATPGGEVSANVKLTTTTDNERMDVTVTAGGNWVVKNVVLAAPYVIGPMSASNKTFSAFKEGTVLDWPTDQWVWHDSSIWPQMGYSPLAVFYNQDTTEGVGVVSFDPGLKNRAVYWLTGPREVHPLVRWMPDIAPGTSQSTTFALHHGFNMPTDMFSYYRNNFLKPFMDSQGIPEGTFGTSGVMSTNAWPRSGNVATSVQWSKSWGANGYLQYAPGDNISYYEPNPEVYPWFSTLSSASKTPGLSSLGVLIDPFMGSHYTPPTTDPNSPSWFPSANGLINLNDPTVQAWVSRLKSDLVAQGVNFAFWDSGSGAPNGEEMAWFNVLKSFKQAGITIAAESSNDIASYITGTNFYDQMRGDSLLARTVTPLVKPVVMDDHLTPDSSGQYWWEQALARGWVPILHDNQLMTYGSMHGYFGLPL